MTLGKATGMVKLKFRKMVSTCLSYLKGDLATAHMYMVVGKMVKMEAPMHYVHFVKYDDAVSFYDAVSNTIRRRGGNRGIFTEEGVDTVAYFGGNHGSRV